LITCQRRQLPDLASVLGFMHTPGGDIVEAR